MRNLKTALAPVLACIFGAAAWHVSILAPAYAQQRVADRPTSTLVWQGDKVDIGGSVSPDGRYMSFTDWATGDLSLHDLARNASRTIVAANNAQGRFNYAENSTISRDGRQVAYSWFDDGKDTYELWIAGLRGDAKPRQLNIAGKHDWLQPRDWSPDGKWIAAFLYTSNDFTLRLALIPVMGGDLRVLKAGQWRGDTRAFFSPDGRYLAYDLPQEFVSARDVWVTAVDGSSDTRVVAHRANDVAMGWSPDGRHLLFTSDRTGTMALFSLEMQSGTPRSVPRPLKPDMGFAVSMGVTSAGALFWGTQSGRRGGSIQLAEFDLESGTVTARRDVSSSPQEDNVNPSWSPDGRYLAYVSVRGRPGEPPTIVLRTADGGLLRDIEPKLNRAELAGWTPDSKALLVVGEGSSGQRGTFRLDIGSGKASFLFATPNSPTLNLPTLSMDGGTLYYWNRISGSTERVFVARHLASGVEKELARRLFLGALVLSPDGRFLATESVDPKSNERVILLVPTDGTGPRELMRVSSGVAPNDLLRVTDRGTRLAPASWGSTSRSFIAKLQRELEGPSELWEVPIDGGSARKLETPLEAHVFRFAVSPDGRRVAFRIKEAEPALPQQIWKFEHFIPASAAPKWRDQSDPDRLR